MSSTITINGKTIKTKSSSISIVNGKVIVGNKILGDEYVDFPNEKEISIQITGDVKNIDVDACMHLSVKGNAGSIKTVSGDVTCDNVLGNINTVSGDVNCDDVQGSISTVSGDVN